MHSEESREAEAMAGQQADDLKKIEAPETAADSAPIESGKAERASSHSNSSSMNGTAIPADVLAEFHDGVVVDGKYRIDRIVGRGGMGLVAAATHLQLHEKVALKFLFAKNHAAEEDFRTRFRREAKVSAKLKNEHITRVIDVGIWREQFPYMVMDLLEGADLRAVLRSIGGKLPIAVAIEYVVQLCEGVAEAHANAIVHRDIKPSNLFITKRPDGSDLLKILDFGISKWTQSEGELDELTQTGVVLGSPKYMAPEQLFGSADVDARADVWSVGAILYEMLAGRPPYDYPSLTRICGELASDRMPPPLKDANPEVSPELEAVVMRCFLRAPEERIQNVADLAGAVLDAVGAPAAAHVRAKVQSILDPKSMRDAMSASGSLLTTTGGFAALPVSQGRLKVGADSSSRATTSDATTSDAPPNEPKRGAWMPFAVVVLLLLSGALAVRVFATSASPPGRVEAPQPSSSSPTAPQAASAPPEPAPSVAPSASAAASAASAAAPPTPSATARPPGVGFRPPPRPTAPPTTAQAEPPPPPPPPPASTQEPPKKKPNPLEDRQ